MRMETRINFAATQHARTQINGDNAQRHVYCYAHTENGYFEPAATTENHTGQTT